eukprot:m.152888 g.152888  ORF g.152888 m.152888 type:complete len:214 (-) comp17899_c0_seq2:1072-1713(-)
MHPDGECDVRGVYCAASVAKMLGYNPKELFLGTPEWVGKCQTFDGGISAVPGTEAHGGYAFCGLAALVLMDSTKQIDTAQLLNWACMRQMKYEGGFQGRANKLVDGCYSFWVGGVFPLLFDILQPTTCDALFDRDALRDYILFCCQSDNGGLRDKPGKHRDYYHTCYCLSGLSLTQSHEDVHDDALEVSAVLLLRISLAYRPLRSLAVNDDVK